MKLSAIRNFFCILGIIGFFLVLLFKTQAVDFDRHNLYASDLRRLNELDARIDRNILKARDRMLTYYDPINADFSELKRIHRNLKQTPNFLSRQATAAIEQLLQEYIAAFQTKEELSEYFKTKNATLNNSLAYFPIAVEELIQQAEQNGGDREFISRWNNLLQDVLIYNLSPNPQLLRKIDTNLETIRQQREEFSSVVNSTDFETTIAHARIILQHFPQVNDTIAQAFALPTVERSDSLAQAYERYYQQAIQTASIYRFLLYAFSLIGLIATAAAIILKLQRSAKAIRRAEAKYHSIFENSIDGIFQTTPEGQYLSANPALARIYGYESPEQLCAQLTQIDRQLYVLPERRREFVYLIDKRGIVADFESQVYRRDGEIIWISESARAVRDRDGTLSYYEGTVVDITARKQAEEALHLEREKSERLLLNILPKEIAEQLKQTTHTLTPHGKETLIAQQFDLVTILFADIVGFTSLSARKPARELVGLLNQIFSEFDRLAQRHGLEKIKTIGDAYMVAGGLPMPRADHAEAIAEMALEIQQEIARFQENTGESFQIRIGINTGPVIAGVIGRQKFIYDLWGDAVNIASRMESSGLPGKIQATIHTYQLLRDRYTFEERGVISVKGRGKMMTYWLLGRKACDLRM